MNLIIAGGRVVDPAAGTDAPGEIWIADGRIVAPGAFVRTDATVLDASGRLVAPAFIDLHVHLREPGNDAAETIASGTRAAAAGGFQTVVAMPNTRPPLDDPGLVRFQIETARAAGFAAVVPSACLTKGRMGTEVADLEALAAAGAGVFTDDGSTVMDDTVMREAMRRAAALGIAVMDHAQDRDAERRGVMHEGARSRQLGLPGIPSGAETRIVERDIHLAREAGCRLHIQHISGHEALTAVCRAAADGVPVTAEVTPHHLALCDDDIREPDPNFKMNPPLRSARDREALEAAVADGRITCLATDHAPHTAEAKARGFLHAPFGIIGLETAIGVTWERLVRAGKMTALDWVRRWTSGPAAVLRRPPPSLAAGTPANVVLIEVDAEWTVDPSAFFSRSRNTPFAGWTLHARPVTTIHKGQVVPA
ncbi:MAG: dihydroorotase [Verrucomicrobia bacterium]|nr:dihydroorotase [Verrucomicrobiota bacterium]